MDSVQVYGGVPLCGKVRIQGSKNAALPVLAATLLTRESSTIYNCPKISDVDGMICLLKSLGMDVCWEEQGIRISRKTFRAKSMDAEAIKGMRSSLCLLGAILGSCGEITMEYPGGCMIGARPIDIHIAAFQKMGVAFSEVNGLLHASAKHLRGAEIELPFPSVGATENVILAATMAEGETFIRGAAKEPEVIALCSYLQACGALITGSGTSEITVQGGRPLYGTEFTIPTDRIVAGTYLFATVATGGCTLLEHAPVMQLDATIRVAEKMGAVCHICSEGLFVQAPERPKAVEIISTAPYPGFPTDLQSMALVTATLADGMTVIRENIFENRFRIVDELMKMGANIQMLNAGCARIDGVERLKGTTMTARELRGGAALLIAATAAKGKSTISGCKYIYRGYERIENDLRELGARIAGV
jgi:UDP-N-acetylglucosamine 1-carboxyvinyltransferase